MATTVGVEVSPLDSDLLREQLDATTAVLRVMADAPGHLDPVLETLAASTARLCNVRDVVVWHVIGDRLETIFRYGPVAAAMPRGMSVPFAAHPEWASATCVLQRRTIHVSDWEGAEGQVYPETREGMRRMGWRAGLGVPLVRQGVGVGMISAYRPEPTPFTPEQVRLVEAFADQAVIAIENTRLLHELREENTRKREEIARARAIQERLLPTSLPVPPGLLDLAFRFRAALETSGDFYDVSPLPAAPDSGAARLQVVVADVAGKGMGAALVMSLTRALLRMTANLPELCGSPAAVARFVGEQLHRDVGRENFVCCAIAVIEMRGSAVRLRMTNAGQPAPLLVRGESALELLSPGPSVPLGAFEGAAYEEIVVDLEPGDVVAFSSDGLAEAPARLDGWKAPALASRGIEPPSVQGELFGFDRMARSAAHWATRVTRADEVAQGIWSDLTAWCGEESHHDDETLVVLRVPAPG